MELMLKQILKLALMSQIQIWKRLLNTSIQSITIEILEGLHLFLTGILIWEQTPYTMLKELSSHLFFHLQLVTQSKKEII